MSEDFIRKLRNFFIKGFFHLVGFVILAWIMGAVLAAATNQMSIIDFDTKTILLLKKLNIWLFNSWNAIGWKSYKYIKLKILASNIVPLLITLILYRKYFDQIMEWDPIQKREKVYGNASWATQIEIKKAGLRCKEGMLLGVDRGGYFVADGFQHALLFAPTGSGKGVGFVLPNLLFWDDSVVVHDIKLENHMLTSGWRAKQGQEVFVWEPANPDGVTHCYNPIDWVSNKPGQMVDDVQKISSLILPKQEFWENEARSLFVGVILYLLADSDKPNSFGEAVRTLRSDDVTYNFAVALDTLGEIMHPVAYMNIAAFLQKADQERSGVVSTLNSGLELWANPLIDAATATSDFNVLEFKKKKTSVFVGLTPDNIQRLQKLMQVFYQQSTEFLSRKMPDLKEEPYGVMFLMDEFPTLGKMEQFKAGIAYFRGYRVRLFLIIQDTQQLKGTYEEAGMNSFLSNSTYRITFAANNYETANLISQLCGNKTVQQTSKSSPQFFDLNPATRTQNVSEVQRALLLPQEVIQLPRDEQIILIESQPPIRSKKIRYYADKFFTARLLPPTFVPTQKPYDPRAKDDEEDEEDSEEETNTEEEAIPNDNSDNAGEHHDEAEGEDIEYDLEEDHNEDDVDEGVIEEEENEEAPFEEESPPVEDVPAPAPEPESPPEEPIEEAELTSDEVIDDMESNDGSEEAIQEPDQGPAQEIIQEPSEEPTEPMQEHSQDPPEELEDDSEAGSQGEVIQDGASTEEVSQNEDESEEDPMQEESEQGKEDAPSKPQK